MHISIPEHVHTKEIIEKNKVIRLAEKPRKVELEYLESGASHILVEDDIGRKIIIKQFRSTFQNDEEAYSLKSKKKLTDISDIDSEAKFIWDKYPVDNITASELPNHWKDKFYLRANDNGIDSSYLRKPQIGALHAISSHWSISPTDPATVVMPTGTGKTETMLSTIVYNRCPKVLIIVPSNNLRMQTFNKCLSLGCLADIGAVKHDLPLPYVGLFSSGFKDIHKAKYFIEHCNIIVATVQILQHKNVRELFAECCSHLFIDEAHHVKANTWQNIKDIFSGKPILQFTATPFRSDGKHLGGKIIYNFPLSMARDEGYFKKINFRSIERVALDLVDHEIAKTAIESLDKDLEAGYDHLLMARASSIKKAEEIFNIYSTLKPDYCPVVIHNQVGVTSKQEKLEKLLNRESRILVCVDMFGEGFDFPNLKIAAVHDVHRSLGVLLQFTGRFTRDSSNVSDATIIMNTHDLEVKKDIEQLYSQNSDWNKLISQKSESRIQEEVDLQNLLERFEGGLLSDISLWNLFPAMSTYIFKVNATEWQPDDLVTLLKKKMTCSFAFNREEDMLVAVVVQKDEVNWGKYRDINNINMKLIIAHFDRSNRILLLHLSDKTLVTAKDMAEILFNGDVASITGQSLTRVFSNVKRPIARSLGTTKTGDIKYTMHFGSDVTEGLSKVKAQTSELNNIFAWGYEDGERVTYGCSVKKGKIWALCKNNIYKWKEWAKEIYTKVSDSTLEYSEIIKKFILAKPIGRHPNLVPISIEWGDHITVRNNDYISFYFDSEERDYYDLEIKVAEFGAGEPVKIIISSEGIESQYLFTIRPNRNPDSEIGEYTYEHVSGPEVCIKLGNSDAIEFIKYMDEDPVIIIYANGSYSYNCHLCELNYEKLLYNGEDLKALDWNGIDITKESQTHALFSDSVQYGFIQHLIRYGSYDIIFDDDGSGEAADIVAIKNEQDQIILKLIHCKYSLGGEPGARVGDLYEVCGQCVKSIKHKHNGVNKLKTQLLRRDKKRLVRHGVSRFIVGDEELLKKITKESETKKVVFKVSIVQPGLSKAKVSPEILTLLSSTYEYLQDTSNAAFEVFCSE